MIERKLYDVFKKKSSYLYSICDCICSHPARERELVSTSMLNWTERCTHTVDTIKSVWFTSMTIKSLNEIIDIDKFIMFALLPLNIHSFQFKHASWQVNKLSTCFSTHSAYTHTHTLEPGGMKGIHLISDWITVSLAKVLMFFIKWWQLLIGLFVYISNILACRDWRFGFD